MLFHKNTKKAIRIASIVIGVLVIVSMVLLYFPSLYT